MGGGIGGVEAAIRLRKAGLKVRLISDRDYLYIYPLSIWVPTKTIEFEDLKMPLEGLASVHGFDLTIDTVTDICVSEKRVALQEHEMIFDSLIIALGGEKVQHKGMEHTISICAKPEDSIKLKDKLEELIEKGSGKIAIGFGGNPKDPSGVRGGPAVEFVFNVLHYLKKKNIRNNFEISFFAPMELLGARLGEGNALKMKELKCQIEREKKDLRGLGFYDFIKKIMALKNCVPQSVWIHPVSMWECHPIFEIDSKWS